MMHPISLRPVTLLAEGGGASAFGSTMLPMLLMLAVVYLLVLRPMSTQEKQRRKRITGLKKGDKVVISGGILGRISNVDDDKVAIVEIADKVKIRVLRKDISDTEEGAMADGKDAKAKPSDTKAQPAAEADDKGKTDEKGKKTAKGA